MIFLSAIKHTIVEYGTNFETDTKTIISTIFPLTIIGLDNCLTYDFKVTAVSSAATINTTPEVYIVLPQVSRIQPQQLGLLINDKDLDSVDISEYY
jgi:hypothetical protein